CPRKVALPNGTVSYHHYLVQLFDVFFQYYINGASIVHSHFACNIPNKRKHQNRIGLRNSNTIIAINVGYCPYGSILYHDVHAWKRFSYGRSNGSLNDLLTMRYIGAQYKNGPDKPSRPRNMIGTATFN